MFAVENSITGDNLKDISFLFPLALWCDEMFVIDYIDSGTLSIVKLIFSNSQTNK